MDVGIEKANTKTVRSKRECETDRYGRLADTTFSAGDGENAPDAWQRGSITEGRCRSAARFRLGCELDLDSRHSRHQINRRSDLCSQSRNNFAPIGWQAEADGHMPVSQRDVSYQAERDDIVGETRISHTGKLREDVVGGHHGD